jgi:CheY-like chemotaxis protein
MKKRILIVDDDQQLNKINEKILTAAGIVSELHIVLNGKEAMDYLIARVAKNYPLPDLIILDLDMPVMDGFGFIDEFQRSDLPGKDAIEIVVFTSSSSPRDKQKALAKGIKYYLSKPYLLRGLNDIILTLKAEQADLYSNRKTFGLESTIP